MRAAATSQTRGIIEPPRRSPWGVALDLYRSGGSFRGFLEFALIGMLVLSFTPGGGVGRYVPSWLRGPAAGETNTGKANSLDATSGPISEFAKPSLPLAPRISDAKIDQSYFDGVAEPLRSALRDALHAYYKRNPKGVVDALAGADQSDPHVLLMRGLNQLAIPGQASIQMGLELLNAAADKGEPRAMVVLGILKISGVSGLTRDAAAGRDLLTRAAAAGDASAARIMGEGFVTGWMGTVDAARAEQYLRLAAERGDLRGTLRLGEMLVTGHGVPKNEREGGRLIQKAAIDGYPEAQAMYGTMRFLAYAGGLTDNPDEALEWLERAAAKSEPHAMYYLGMFYVEYGKRIGRLDPARGADLFRRCSEITMQPKCVFAYATALDLGIGVPRDAMKAYSFYSIAAANENGGKARTRRDEIAKTLSPQQIAQSHQITNELIRRGSRPVTTPSVNERFADHARPLR